jgi:arylformamidase
MRYVYLSYYIHEKSPVYVGLKTPSILTKCHISSEGYNTSIIIVENHSGTHVDAPAHFLEEGKTIGEYSLEDLIFSRVMIWDCPQASDELIDLNDFYKSDLNKEDIKNVECLLIRTGFSQYRTKDLSKYLTNNPGISEDFIHHIRNNYPQIRALGIDCVSISPYNNPESATKAHKTAFVRKEDVNDENYGEPLLLIEDMKLQNIPAPGNIEKLFVVPWQIKGMDSAPCTVIAQLR